jgi:hypothetical protein
MAVIAERVETTGGGRLCILLLILIVIGTVFAYLQATTVFQQIEAGVSFIGGCILFGLGVALGRSRPTGFIVPSSAWNEFMYHSGGLTKYGRRTRRTV